MKEKYHFHSFDAHLHYQLFKHLNFLNIRGSIGVYFFFVLSGFLITYILLHEKKTTNTINLKHFFIRRILRIWPLYYAILLFAYLTPYIISCFHLNSSSLGYEPNWLLSSLFLENYQVIYHHNDANVSPLPVLWSLCIEEHFYVVWGLLLYFTSIKKVPMLMVTMIVIAFISRYVFIQNNLFCKDLLTNIDFFMYGAFPAFAITMYKEKTITLINNVSSLIKYCLLITTLLYIFFSSYILNEMTIFIEPVVFGLFFSSVIFIFLPQENQFKISSKSLFSRLGNYTYSLYLVHVIVINLVIHTFKIFTFSFERHYFLFILLAIALTIVTSYASFKLIEKPFLKLKKHFY
jgi:peptidoglycan/LPS O-acetylase OafA/YrhL